VVRRGRRERLPSLLEGPLCEVIRDALASQTSGALDVVLYGGVRLVASLLVDGRVALRARRAGAVDVALAHLVEEGLVPLGVDAELTAAPLGGQCVIVLGPAQVARVRLAVAVARACATRLRVVALTAPAPAQCLPAPATGSDDLVEVAVRAAQLGADAVFAEVSVRELVRLVDAALPVPVIAACAAPSLAVVRLAFARANLDPGLAALALGLVAVCGLAADGRPRLLELHGESGAPASPSPSAASPPTPTPAPGPEPRIAAALEPAYEAPPREVSGFSTRRTIVADEPGLGEAPPAEWASEDIDDDPGWELGPIAGPTSDGEPPPPAAPGSFDAALQAVSKRPTFQPKAPPPHPQAAALRGTGGLTFEPPGGAPDDE
jgi:hypothetical protein